MRAVDTNVLVRLLTRDDAKQTDAAEQFVGGGAWVSHLVLMDAAWVLATVYDVGRSELATAIGMLLHHESLTVEDSDVVEMALKQLQAKPAVGFSDCLILEVARKAGHLPLGTFDRTFGRIDGTRRI